MDKPKLTLQKAWKDEALDIEHIGRYTLSLMLGNDEFLIAAFDARTGRCVLFEEHSFEPCGMDECILMLSKLQKEHSFLSAQHWQKINLILYSRDFAFVPAVYFDDMDADRQAEFASSYLKLNSQPDFSQAYVQFSHLAGRRIVCVFTVPKTLSDWLESAYPTATLSLLHLSACFLQGLMTLENQQNDCLHVHVRDNVLCIAALTDGQLNFINNFEFSTKEDFVYYILMCIESLKIAPGRANIMFYGDIVAEGTAVNLLSQYVPSIQFSEGLKTSSAEANPKIDLAPYRHFALMSSFIVP